MRKLLLAAVSLLVAVVSGGCGGGSQPDVPSLDASSDAPVPRVDAPGVDASGLDAPLPSDAPGAPDAPERADAPAPIDAPVVEPISILVLGTFESAGRRATMFEALLASYGTVTFAPDSAVLDEVLLAPHDLLVFGNLPNSLTSPERGDMVTWMTVTGGDVLVMGGYGELGAEVQSIIAPFSAHVPADRAGLDEAVFFVSGAVSQGTLTAPVPHDDAQWFDTVSAPSAAAEITTSTGTPIAARFQSSAPGGGRAFMYLDEGAVLDTEWTASHETFWRNILGWLAE